MATPTWGMLAKGQDDPETIEEAIARLIAEHNEDEEAHLGSGQSLQSHKISEVIDHAIRSIVADKFSGTQKWFRSTFDSIDGWGNVIGNVSPAWPGVRLLTTAVTNNNATLGTNSAGDPDFLDFSKNLLFQTNFRVPDITDVEIYINWGPDPSNLTGESAFGFRYVSDQLQAFYHDGSDFSTENIADIDMTDVHVYRAEVDSTAEEINFYIDGVLVATISCAGSTYSENRGPCYYIKTLEDMVKYLLVGEVFLAKD